MAARAVVISAVLAAVGCGGGGGSNPDGAPSDSDGPPPATDASPPPWAIEITIDGAVGDEVNAEVVVGQSETIDLVIANTGTAPSPDLELVVFGPAAVDYAVATGCEDQPILPGASCAVALTFHPSAAGLRTATLEVRFATTVYPIAVAGTGVDDGLHLDRAALDFGDVDVGDSATEPVVLTNAGPVAVPIDAITVGGAFAVTHDCPTTLASGASCTIDVTYQPSALGIATGELGVQSAAALFTASLAGRGAFVLTIAKHGDGDIVSTPAGIECGATCSARFTGPVTLTAITAPGIGVYWGDACGEEPTCEVAGPSATALDVFLSTGAVLQVDIDRPLIEVVVVQDDVRIATCAESCAVDLAPGSDIEIFATSVGEVAEISGACTGNRTCGFVMSPGPAMVGVTAPIATNEEWRIAIAGGVHDAAFDSAGNLIVATNVSLLKLDPTGALIWTLPRIASAVEVGPDDTIYVTGTGGLARLTAAGAELWIVPGAGCSGPLSQCLAVGPSGEVAIGGDPIRRYNPDGTLSWSHLTEHGSGMKPAVAIGLDGVVYGTQESADSIDILPFMADGTPLPLLEDYCRYHGGPVVDPATGAMWCVSSGHSAVQWRRSVTSTSTVDTDSHAWVRTNIVGTAAGPAGWVFEYDYGDETPWYLLRSNVLTGTNLGSHMFPLQRFDEWPLYQTTHSHPIAVTGSPAGRIAVAAQFAGFGLLGAFVISYAPTPLP
jgi:hypothetical protein